MTIAIMTADNRTLTVNAEELAEIIRQDGIDKIEVQDNRHGGWIWLSRILDDLGFVWDEDDDTAENIARVFPILAQELAADPQQPL